MAMIRAIDVLYSPEPAGCSGGVPAVSPCAEKPETLLTRMNAAGVGQVLLAPCKRWECERHWMCAESQVDDVAQYTRFCPERFAGIAAYNPFSITESVRQLRSAIRLKDMRGVYIHTEGADVSLLDRRMYPLYSRSVELGVPVVLQVGFAGGKGLAHPAEIAIIINDFPELDIVAGWTGPLDFEWIEKLASKSERMFFAFPANASEQDAPTVELLESPVGHRCMWGSNALPWQNLLDHVHGLGLSTASLNFFLHDLAADLFHLSRKTLPPLDSEENLLVAD